MSRQVVDASVVAAAFFQERHARAAQSVLMSGQELLAPDLIVAEMANVIWKRYSRREIDATEASDLLTDFLRLPLQLTASSELALVALELATGSGRTVYDCLYLTLAMKTKSVMVTADKRLANALADTPLSRNVLWIGQRGWPKRTPQGFRAATDFHGNKPNFKWVNRSSRGCGMQRPAK